MSSYKYKFSVVIPVYNVEEYIAEAIDSIVGQTIGFEDNIQVILVNDGSTDNSEKVCLEYRDKYPNNIIYVKQENAGVSAARNKGLQYIEGEIVNFIDSDDKWDENAFKYVYRFYKKNNNEMDVVTSTIQLFEAKTGNHTVNYRMKAGARVADINDEEEYDSIVVQVATSFFRAEAIQDVRFKEGLKFGEDSLFVNSVILKKCKIGFQPKAVYFYRRRDDGTSAVQVSKRKPEFFIETIDNYHIALMDICKKMHNKVLPYIQNVVYYDMGWRFRLEVDEVLTPEEKEQFYDRCRKVMSDIDVNIILKNKVHRNFITKNFAYKMKFGREMMEDMDIDPEEHEFQVAGIPLLVLSASYGMCRVNFLEIKGHTLHIEGSISKWLLDMKHLNPRFVVRIGRKEVEPVVTEHSTMFMRCPDGKVHTAYRFSADVPLKRRKKPKFDLKVSIYYNGIRHNVGVSYSKFVPTTSRSGKIYKDCGKYIFRAKKKAIQIFRKSQNPHIKLRCEWEQQRWLRKKKKKKMANFRIGYFFHRLFNRPKDKIWLISDRVMNAGDNGEVFFKYLNSIKTPGVQPVFAISKDAECVERLQSEGKVVFFESKEYLYTFLDADKIISSGASEFTLNPFGGDRPHVQDLFKYDFYYLQHGVACADLSGWLTKDAKDIKMMFTASPRERESIINDKYRYDEDTVVLTGQSRFDELYDDSKKQILILPTWRKSIKKSYDSNTTSVYYDGFVDTEYYQFYNGLMNHPRLLEKMREKGYTGLFCLHPIHKEQWIDFKGNDVFKVNEGYVNYNEVFAHSALTVTDYSSVIFDFAYLRKYIIYAQFDKEQFFNDQTYDEGYFDYEEDGFGPVCYDLEETVDSLIKAIENDCKTQDKYKNRIDSFFAYSDQKNCERIYKAIMKREENKKR